jgi:Fe-S cluster biogenesis protein NfuA
MFIQTQSTPNALALKFLPGRDVSPQGSHDFSSFRAASAASPLAALLFGIDGVQGVYLGPDFVSVNVREGSDWSLLKPEIYAAIMDFYSSGKPVVYEAPLGEGGAAAESSQSSTTVLPTDSEVVAMIKELIETRIRPAVQEDGGDIDYRSFDEATGIVRVQMQGACKGCASSAITLKNGIENMLMHYVPEVKAVEEDKDEAQSVGEAELQKLEQKLQQAQPTAAL